MHKKNPVNFTGRQFSWEFTGQGIEISVIKPYRNKINDDICNYSADGTVKVLNGYDNLIFANREPSVVVASSVSGSS